MKRTVIIGAGMSGLIAAHFHPDANIYDMRSWQSKPKIPGLHYLHSTVYVDDWLEEVGLRLIPDHIWGGIYWKGDVVPHSEATEEMIAAHLLKSRGITPDMLAEEVRASLMNRAVHKRDEYGYNWLTVYSRLLAKAQSRICWGKKVGIFGDHRLQFVDGERVSFDECYVTVPLPYIQSIKRMRIPTLYAQPVYTYIVTQPYPYKDRYWDYIYFPEPEIPFYRASWPDGRHLDTVIESASPIDESELQTLGTITNKSWMPLGHILEVPQVTAIVAECTEELRQLGYILCGRFAQWQHKIRADSVVEQFMRNRAHI